MKRQFISFLIPCFALLLTCFVFQSANAQTTSSAFSFRSGQSMYIVAYRRAFVNTDSDNMSRGYYQNELALDVEQKVRMEIEKWKFFRVVDKISEADFILLVNSEYSSMEGLAISQEAYRQYYKEKYDYDNLREAAYSRCLAGPLKLPTLGRLSERLIKDFREKITKEKSAFRVTPSGVITLQTYHA